MIAGTIDFALPAHLEARRPPEARGLSRDGVRLLATDRSSGENIDHNFSELPELLEPGDLLVVNDSATLPAALDARRLDNQPIALHLSARVANTLWIVEPRGPGTSGERLRLPANGCATLLAPVHPDSERLWYARIDVAEPHLEYLHRHGRAIRYAYLDGTYPISDYQTIFARVPGSAEMPSAGRPFTARTLAALRARDVSIAHITLHAGVSSAEAHESPQAEPFIVSEKAARAVAATHRAGRRVIAVGTTVVRALESAAAGGAIGPASGWTDLIVTRERGVQVVDGLLTGFHEPRASHLAMLQAIAPPSAIDGAYRHAIEREYLWHEFGDVHLIASKVTLFAFGKGPFGRKV